MIKSKVVQLIQCVVIKNEIPILSNVTVVETGVSDGIDSIVWYRPFDLDTTIYLPPYHYSVKNDSGQIIYQGAPSFSLQNLDTSFNFTTNTTDTNRFYSVGIYYNANGIGLYLANLNQLAAYTYIPFLMIIK